MEKFLRRMQADRPDGRQLDIADSTVAIRGATSPISVDREEILASTFYELLAADGREYDVLDIRVPLEVIFCGEGRWN